MLSVNSQPPPTAEGTPERAAGGLSDRRVGGNGIEDYAPRIDSIEEAWRGCLLAPANRG